MNYEHVGDKSGPPVQTLSRCVQQRAIDQAGASQLEQDDRGSYSTQTATNRVKCVFLKKRKGNYMDLNIINFPPNKPTESIQNYGIYYASEARVANYTRLKLVVAPRYTRYFLPRKH